MKHNTRSTGVLFYGVCYFLWTNASGVSLKAVESCYPACSLGRGLCIEGRCFCHSPYGGADCSEIVYNPSPENEGVQRQPSGDDIAHRHTSREDDSESSNDDDTGSDLNLFGVGDEAPEHARASRGSSEVPEPSLHMLTGELSLQQNTFGSNGLASLDDSGASSRLEQEVAVDAHRADATMATWPSTPAPTQVPTTSEGTTSVIQTVARSVWQWPDAFRWLRKTPDVVPAEKPSLKMPTNHKVLGSHVQGRQSLRHHRRHQERPLLFASSEPAVQVTDSGNLSCVPWLAELRAVDLYNLTLAQVAPALVDLKIVRQQAYETRLVAGIASLSKVTFLKSLPNWFNGPTYGEGSTLFDRLDSSSDGVLTFEEYNWENICGYRGALLSALSAYGKAWTQGFSFLDTNSDGGLQEEEFVKESIGVKLGLSNSVATTIFKSMDSDGSGVVDRKEFEMIGGLPRLRVQVGEKEPDEASAFKQADTNNDGHLDDSEFSAHAKDMGDFRETRAIPLALLEIDKNKDGLVQKDEYVNTCWTKTGGVCNEGHCHRWRGPASCGLVSDGHFDRPCVCAPGYCAKNGACIPEELHTSADQILGPAAGRVLDKMHEVNADTLFSQASMNPAEGVVAVMLTVTIMMQLKASFISFPMLGVFIFTISVIAFYLVTVTCFRAFSVPDSIENPLQLLVLILVCCAVTLSITSLSRIWAPRHSRIPFVCWFVTDDEHEYGLSRSEEIKVQTYSSVFKTVAFLCAFGLYEAPLEGVRSFSTKFMLIGLYVCIIVLDTQLLDLELKQTASRRYKHELHMSQVSKIAGKPDHIDTVVISSLAAWWNELTWQSTLWQFRDIAGLNGKLDTFHKEKLSNVVALHDNTKRFCKFHTVRVPEPPAVAKQPERLPRQPRCEIGIRECTEMFFLSSRSGVVFGNYVYGRLVVLWEDTEIEFVWKTKDASRDGKEVWRTFEQIEQLSRDKGLTDEHESPVLRELPGILATTGGANQTIQEKMLICAQAGASGLIVGQRKGGHLNADSFDLFPHPPDASYYTEPGNLRNTWRGSYHLKRFATPERLDSLVKTSDGKLVYNRHDFVVGWMRHSWAHWMQLIYDESDTTVEDGVAINTFLISNCDMQELEWILEERLQDSGSEIAVQNVEKGEEEVVVSPRDGQLSPVPMLFALYSARASPVITGETNPMEASALSRLALPVKGVDQQAVKKGFSRVFAHQRLILANVVQDIPGAMDFLTDCRTWVEQAWFTRGIAWKVGHLGATCFALIFVLDMSWFLLRRIHQNNFGVWADFLVLVIMVLNGQNISIPIDWFPFKVDKEWTPGVILTAIVLVAFYSLAISLFLYHALGFVI